MAGTPLKIHSNRTTSICQSNSAASCKCLRWTFPGQFSAETKGIDIMCCCRNFQSFDTSQAVDQNPDAYGKHSAYTAYYDPNAYSAPDPIYDGGSSEFDNEPPLLEGNSSLSLDVISPSHHFH